MENRQRPEEDPGRRLVPLAQLQLTLDNIMVMTLLPPSPPYADGSLSPSSPSPASNPIALGPPSNSGSNSPSATPTTTSNGQDSHKCLWEECELSYGDPEVLYNHLCNDHIGRKSTNNLCLTCRWKDCGTTCAKRDHITSHLRGAPPLLMYSTTPSLTIGDAVHTPLKPHACDICRKSFKRPQDLKKHEKIHTEEHHQQHKHSKAITITSTSPTPPSHSHPQSQWGRSTSSAGSGRHLSADADLELLPTPSPELGPRGYSHHPSHHQHQQIHVSGYHPPPQPQLPTWETLKPDGTTGPAVGSKRGYGDLDGVRGSYGVEEFFSDMKKRRVEPSYDIRMSFLSLLSRFILFAKPVH